MSYLTRAADAQATWPFGQMDELQALRHEQDTRALIAREARELRERADQARRELFARLGEASQ